MDKDLTQKDMSTMFFLFVVLFSFFSVIPLIIHINFWSLDRNLCLSLEANHIKVTNKQTGFTIRIEYADIGQIEITTCSSNRAFWGENEYLKIMFNNNNRYIHFTNYLIEPLELRTKLADIKFNNTEEFIPLLADRQLGNDDKALRIE